MVNQGALNQALADAKSRGNDVNQMAVRFSLDAVIFSDELQWYRGKMLHPDSATPGKWIPVDQPLALKTQWPIGPGIFILTSRLQAR